MEGKSTIEVEVIVGGDVLVHDELHTLDVCPATFGKGDLGNACLSLLTCLLSE